MLTTPTTTDNNNNINTTIIIIVTISINPLQQEFSVSTVAYTLQRHQFWCV